MGPVSREWSHASHCLFLCWKIHLGAAILECSYLALQRVATVWNKSLTLHLYFGFKSLLPAPREPWAAHRAWLVLREASSMPCTSRVSLTLVSGPCQGQGWQQPWSGEPLPAEHDLLCFCLKSFGPIFSSLWDAVPCVFSTSCSRQNPKSIPLSKKCF